MLSLNYDVFMKLCTILWRHSKVPYVLISSIVNAISRDYFPEITMKLPFLLRKFFKFLRDRKNDQNFRNHRQILFLVLIQFKRINFYEKIYGFLIISLGIKVNKFAQYLTMSFNGFKLMPNLVYTLQSVIR